MSSPAKNLVLPTGQDLELLVDALVRVSAVRSGLSGEAAITHIEELKARLVAVDELGTHRLDDSMARRQAADEVDKLVATLGQIQKTTGRALQRASPQVKAALRGVDLGRMGEALRFVAHWLREPTAEREAEIALVVEQLRLITGAVDPMTDPWADEKTARELEEGIDADVSKSLDDIFGDLKEPT
jgi:hypothetical protein